MKRTFKAADGRRVVASISIDDRVEHELLNMATVVMPIITILLFAMAAGVIK